MSMHDAYNGAPYGSDRPWTAPMRATPPRRPRAMAVAAGLAAVGMVVTVGWAARAVTADHRSEWHESMLGSNVIFSASGDGAGSLCDGVATGIKRGGQTPDRVDIDAVRGADVVCAGTAQPGLTYRVTDTGLHILGNAMCAEYIKHGWTNTADAAPPAAVPASVPDNAGEDTSTTTDPVSTADSCYVRGDNGIFVLRVVATGPAHAIACESVINGTNADAREESTDGVDLDTNGNVIGPVCDLQDPSGATVAEVTGNDTDGKAACNVLRHMGWKKWAGPCTPDGNAYLSPGDEVTTAGMSSCGKSAT